MEPKAIRRLRTLILMIIALDSDIDDYRTRSRRGKRSKYVREVENKKMKISSKVKCVKATGASLEGRIENEPVYTALVRKDNSDSFIPFLFSLKSVNAFDAQLYYNHSDCKVTLSSATFVFFSEESPRLYSKYSAS